MIWRQFRLESASRLLFESVLIVLSVALGFALTEWREARADRDLAARVLRNLRAEVEFNVQEIDARLPRHQQMIEAFRSVDLSDSSRSGWDVILETLQKHGGGVEFPLPRHAAWDAAVSTGALRLIDYEVTAALSELYEAQAQLGRVVDQVYGIYQPATFETGRQREVVQMFTWTLTELESTERTLQRSYQKHLKVLQTASR